MLVSNRYTGLLEGRRRTMAVPRAGRGEHVRPGFRREQQRLQIGLRFRSLRHCSIDRSTAASTPRLVTICGPSVALASRNALNRALAS